MNEEKNETQEQSNIKCSFCGSTGDVSRGVVIINGPGVSICTDCVNKCGNIATTYRKQLMKGRLAGGTKPSDIYKHLEEYVIGQEKAKKVLSVAIYNHYKMLDILDNKGEKEQHDLDKSNIILVGPTGVGKTLLVRVLAQMLNVPYAIADATSLTEAGYVGDDPENVIRLLLENADWDIKLAERGIVYIDEIDKLARKGENMSITRDVSGEGVQQALLKMIEGSIVEVPPKGGRKHPLADTVKVNTKNILFIAGGAFEGIQNVITKRQKGSKAPIGFGSDIQSKKDKDFNDLILDVKAEDIRTFGMIPEFVGRMPIICPLQELSKDDLVRILTEPRNAIIKQYQEIMEIDGVDIEFTSEAISVIAEKALENKTGARGLRSVVEEVLLDYMYSIPDLNRENKVEKVVITEECVLSKKEPEIYYKQKEIA